MTRRDLADVLLGLLIAALAITGARSVMEAVAKIRGVPW